MREHCGSHSDIGIGSFRWSSTKRDKLLSEIDHREIGDGLLALCYVVDIQDEIPSPLQDADGRAIYAIAADQPLATQV